MSFDQADFIAFCTATSALCAVLGVRFQLKDQARVYFTQIRLDLSDDEKRYRANINILDETRFLSWRRPTFAISTDLLLHSGPKVQELYLEWRFTGGCRDRRRLRASVRADMRRPVGV